VKLISPDVVRILLTGYADVETVINAVNEGEVFRVLVKPWNDNVLKHAVEEGLKRYQIIRSLKGADGVGMLSLAESIEIKDKYTQGHCERVARYALMISEELDLPEDIKEHIKYGSWLHDCGKVGVPESILNSSTPLNEKELEIIRNHPTWGSYISRHAQLPGVVSNIIQHHHEKYNGKGYPKGIKGEDIPIEARIVSVAECFDAITSDRPYRKAHTKEKGIEIILSMKGEHFDPEIVDVFVSKIKEDDWQKFVQSVEDFKS
jgi:putative nucleotidyltransferase with HDIG domain